MHDSNSSFSWATLGNLLLLYLIVLATNGYVFGADDQVEVLPYALFLGNSNLFPTDFYVQYISQAIPNERYFFSSALALSGAALPIFCGLLHLICSLLLFGGWYRISQSYIQTDFLRWGVILAICLPPFYGINLGGNELYYNTFIPSLLAKSIGVWGLYHFLQRKYNWSIILLALCTFFHPVAGAQLFLILGGVLLWEKGSNANALSWKKIGRLFLTYILTAGLWVLFLKFNFDKGTIEKELLFDIMEFRVPHHYFPSYFPIKYYLLLLPFFGLSIFFFRKRDNRIATFFLFALLGCGIFTFGVEVLKSSSLLTSQWFKSTIWLKAFSLVAIFAFLEERMPFLQKEVLKKISSYALILLAILAIGAMVNPFSIFKNKPYHFFWQTATSPIVDIARQAKEKTPIDATFVIPIQETAFKYYSQRSCYIDYKTMVHRKDALPIWQKRVQEIYGINLQQRRKGKDLYALANARYAARTEEEWKKIAVGKFQYLLTSASDSLTFPIVSENNSYRIYHLQ